MDIDEHAAYEGAVFHAVQMSFDGFVLAAPPHENATFVPGEIYRFASVRSGFSSTSQYIGKKNCRLEFAYKNVSSEEAYYLSRYYVQRLHAAKEVDFDRDAPLT